MPENINLRWLSLEFLIAVVTARGSPYGRYTREERGRETENARVPLKNILKGRRDE